MPEQQRRDKKEDEEIEKLKKDRPIIGYSYPIGIDVGESPDTGCGYEEEDDDDGELTKGGPSRKTK